MIIILNAKPLKLLLYVLCMFNISTYSAVVHAFKFLSGPQRCISTEGGGAYCLVSSYSFT